MTSKSKNNTNIGISMDNDVLREEHESSQNKNTAFLVYKSNGIDLDYIQMMKNNCPHSNKHES